MGDRGKQGQMHTDRGRIGSAGGVSTPQNCIFGTAAKHFPLARLEDHAIKLKPDAPQTINCKVYPLTHAEREATAKFLKENEVLKYIEKTDSPWLTPWFFIKKKDGTLRPIQDYHEVNRWMIRDVYPIPQIEQILEGLHGKEIFTALDI
jgi:hypothetical protein